MPVSDIYLIVSEVKKSDGVPNDLPKHLPEPVDYYEGVDVPGRCVSRRVLLFQRLSRESLQQRHLANRMHHRYVLMHVLETGGIVSVDGKGLRLEAGDSLLVFPYQFHHYIDLDADSLRWIFVTFELQQGGLHLEGLRHCVLRTEDPLLESLKQIAAIWVEEAPAERAGVLPLVDQLLMRLPRVAAPQRPGRRAGIASDSLVAEAETLLLRSVREGWTLHEVARRMHLSERHLRTRFERQTGVSLRDYRNNYQLNRAIDLMRDATLSLSDVAELSGFNSQSVFSRFVRRQTGQAPRELRKRLLTGDTNWLTENRHLSE